MPITTNKQLHIHDFSAEELMSFVAEAQANGKMEFCMLVPGAGKTQELTQQIVRTKIADVKVANMAELPASDRPSGLHVSMPVDCQMLDDWLRPQIPDLPEIGQYAVVQPQRLPDVALRVRWEE
jgi:hypothetical protein